MIEDVPTPGSNTAFRDFKVLDDLLQYIKSFQEEHNIESENAFGSVRGIMHQFMAFDLPVKDRKNNEVLIYFMEEDPRSLESKIKVNTLWFNNKTRKVLNEPPEWYMKLKKEEILKTWN